MQGFPKQILGSIEMRDKSCELFTVEVPLRFKYQAQMPAEIKKSPSQNSHEIPHTTPSAKRVFTTKS
jgi:hypothetical protein